MDHPLRRIRQALIQHGAVEVTDAELLRRFARFGEESAFELLFHRHRKLVWAVCLSDLGHRQDAEDAFQAAFLTLARKADTIRRPGALPGWLRRVARRCARKAAARRLRAAVCGESAEPIIEDREWTADLGPVLDEEIARLPEEYRTAVLLCDRQGMTYEEAARQLGWPKGTLAGRLRRARAILRERLSVRDIAPAVLAGCAVTAAAGQSCFPPVVNFLSDGVIRAMMTAKLKWAALTALAAGVFGVGLWGSRTAEARQSDGTTSGIVETAAPAVETRQDDRAALERQIEAAVKREERFLAERVAAKVRAADARMRLEWLESRRSQQVGLAEGTRSFLENRLLGLREIDDGSEREKLAQVEAELQRLNAEAEERAEAYREEYLQLTREALEAEERLRILEQSQDALRSLDEGPGGLIGRSR